ncbi:hypothetical protein DICPUDRAFT_78852 [Dictyostelium purpureum]|uniref:Uncharacterized protein n=1 Tax=Dictyostelium purpureum TaxID=5786 RepID=F0ZKS8_DICPU|nr:uncharacterized protein DICPUDRAFT_78852 [Dictyostelium purpureum]EGC35464.1 hypothetical protein DICPUDRAFT_78852 [Dictyostelium purpureum]|eukprot:XP_003288007.1 hypothetical protein DICPUDRAFT_78852 [Dictyostelium purpureum]
MDFKYIQKHILKSFILFNNNYFINNNNHKNIGCLKYLIKSKVYLVSKYWFKIVKIEVNKSIVLINFVDNYQEIRNYINQIKKIDSKYSLFNNYEFGPKKLTISLTIYNNIIENLENDFNRYKYFENLKKLTIVLNNSNNNNNNNDINLYSNNYNLKYLFTRIKNLEILEFIILMPLDNFMDNSSSLYQFFKLILNYLLLNKCNVDLKKLNIFHNNTIINNNFKIKQNLFPIVSSLKIPNLFQ